LIEFSIMEALTLSCQTDSETAQQIKEKLGARLEARKEEREQNIQRLKKEKDSLEEEVLSFHSTLDPLVSEIETLLVDCKPESLDLTASKLSELRKFVSDAGFYLPVYELKKSQDKVTELNAKFQALRDTTKPKKKFGFKSSMNKASKPETSTLKSAVGVTADGDAATLNSNVSGSGDNSYVLRDEVDKTFVLGSELVDGKDLDLACLSGCRVEILGKPSTLHMSNLSKCVVFTGSVSTSVMLDRLDTSTVCCSCQQLRMHRSSATDVYLFTSARAIIEDCSEIRFAPLAASEECGQNNWDLVGDFNWLAKDQKSPNWSVIPVDQRIH